MPGCGSWVVDHGHWSIGCKASQGLDIRLLSADSPPDAASTLAPVQSSEALILYTSGTTGSPKGVLLTHANLQAQIKSLVQAWSWSGEDRILNVLPLHHTHGIVNVSMCALWSGACCEILAPFDAGRVWQRLASGDLTLFMAVPTILFSPGTVLGGARWDPAGKPLGWSLKVTADGFRIGGSPGPLTRGMASDQWAHSARTLRDDGDRHGLSRTRCTGNGVPGRSGSLCPASRFVW